jgi:hypothetical protein
VEYEKLVYRMFRVLSIMNIVRDGQSAMRGMTTSRPDTWSMPRYFFFYNMVSSFKAGGPFYAGTRYNIPELGALNVYLPMLGALSVGQIPR